MDEWDDRQSAGIGPAGRGSHAPLRGPISFLPLMGCLGLPVLVGAFVASGMMGGEWVAPLMIFGIPASLVLAFGLRRAAGAAAGERVQAAMGVVSEYLPIIGIFGGLGLSLLLVIKGLIHPLWMGPMIILGMPAAYSAGRIVRRALGGAAEPTGSGQAKAAPRAGARPSAPVNAPSPPESRFLRIARERGLLSRADCRRLVQWRAQRRDQGRFVTIWDGAVLEGLLDADVAEGLRAEAGELDREAIDGYTVVRKLGEGGMGAVWQAADTAGRTVALKVLSREHASARTYVTRFFREAQAAIGLRHPNLVQGLRVGEDGGLYYYAMEYVPGGSVAERIGRGGRLMPPDCLRIVTDVCRGLAYAHRQGVVHRDVKPANIMLAKDGTAKLADLGLARRIDSDATALTASAQALGTPHYMAPEQIEDARRADARSDIYSLGATWYHMLFGEPPFRGPTALDVCHKHLNSPVEFPDPVARQVPAPVQTLITRMMAKDPAERFASAAELEAALGGLR
jgi:tRNA A-37 threonylcarbamoyl transferase component Bud32